MEPKWNLANEEIYEMSFDFFHKRFWHFDLTWRANSLNRPSWRNSEQNTKIRFTLELPSMQGADRHIDCKWKKLGAKQWQCRFEIEKRYTHTRRRALPEQRRFNFRFCCVEHKFRRLLPTIAWVGNSLQFENWILSFSRKRCEWCWWCLSGGAVDAVSCNDLIELSKHLTRVHKAEMNF